MEMERFVRAWNSLAQRGTTKEEDLLFILSCLTSMVPYLIGNLSPAGRMRALASSYEHLPIALLFDPQLACPENRDPANPWLPLAPKGYTVPVDSHQPCFHLVGDHMVIGPDELGAYYRLIADPTLVSVLGTAIKEGEYDVAGDSTTLDRSQVPRNCYLVRNTSSLHDDGYCAVIEAVRFEVLRTDGIDAECSFEGPLHISLETYRLMQPISLSSIRTSFCE